MEVKVMRVYHLLSADYAISNIAMKRLKVARIGDLNDPFEMMAASCADKRFRRALAQLKEQHNRTRGVLCFSRSWANPVLWSHYADNHRGMALGFDIQDKYAVPIEYSDVRLPAPFKHGRPTGELTQSYVRRLLHTKYSHWSYEEEVRLHVDLTKVVERGGTYFQSFDVGLKLREVILGHYCVSPTRQIRELVNGIYKDVEVRKARLSFREFRIVTDRRSNPRGRQ